jgi:hypothetical protein
MNNALSTSSMPMQMPAPKAPKGKAKPAGDNRGELNRISIEPTENGFEVSCSFDPLKVNPKFDRYSQCPEDEKMSFESTGSAIAYVTKQMSGQTDAEAGEPAGGSDEDGSDGY